HRGGRRDRGEPDAVRKRLPGPGACRRIALAMAGRASRAPHRRALRRRSDAVRGARLFLLLPAPRNRQARPRRRTGFLWDAGTFCVEATMVVAFGVSWAVKGEKLSAPERPRGAAGRPRASPTAPAALNSRPSDHCE